jgi:peptide/nickel transport system permease protein
MILALVAGIPLGVLSAVRKGSTLDHAARLLSAVGFAAPQFWVGIMLILLFAANLKWLPAFGMGGPTHLILPAITIALPTMTGIAMFVRSSMLDALGSEHVKFARIKGVAEVRVLWKHTFRNALIPAVTFIGLQLAGLLNGSVVVEVVFAWPGLGQLMAEGVVQRNAPVVEGTVLTAAAIYIVVSLLVDVAYVALDPRIRRP